MALVVFYSHHDWLSDTLIRYGVITEPLPRIVSDEDLFSAGDENPDDDKYLKSLDPTKWKEQDHYAVLGLRKLRFNATEDEIRRSYRKKILVHHPDKRKGVVDRDNDYFACITKAYEILGDPIKRRSYDSVDPFFDDEIPNVTNHSKKNFFKVFKPVFDRNARWSEVQPVPSLGSKNTPWEEVEKFYAFWYNEFKSWREYSYQDEEEKEKGQDREERRWIEKENRAVRESKKKDEVARIKKLIANAEACDPRVIAHRATVRQEKQNAKDAREKERVRKVEEERNRLEAERLAEEKKKEEEEKRQKEQRDLEKKEKEVLKKKKKLLRKQVQDATNTYMSTLDGKDRVTAMTELEILLQKLSIEDLERFIAEMDSVSDDTARNQLLASKLAQSMKSEAQINGTQKKQETVDLNSNISTKKWSADEFALLTKAAKLFPPGTQKRWEVITNYFNQHTTCGIKRKERDVQEKYHELKNPSSSAVKTSSAEAVQLKNANSINGSIVDAAAIPSERYDPPMEQQNTEKPNWTSEEQKIFEQAMQTYPKTMDKAERWSKIAQCLPGRSAKDCLERYKNLLQMVKERKEAQKVVTKKS